MCWHPHPIATGSTTEDTFPIPPPSNFSASSHYARAAKLLESGRIGASLRKYHFPAKGAKWCQNGQWPAHRAPTSHFLTQPDCLLHAYVHVVHGWGWKRGEQGGGKANWLCLGGSSGGDDQSTFTPLLLVLQLHVYPSSSSAAAAPATSFNSMGP